MDETNEISNFANNLYANLKAVCPKDTGKMRNSITIEDLGDRYLITVSEAVNKDGINYSAYVNYNWGARSNRKKQKYIKKGTRHKERDNYKWVERTIEHTWVSMYGKGSVSNEL